MINTVKNVTYGQVFVLNLIFLIWQVFSAIIFEGMKVVDCGVTVSNDNYFTISNLLAGNYYIKLTNDGNNN